MRHSTTEKISVSLPRELARSMQKRVGARGVSRFVAVAIAHELERAQLGELLTELEDAHGPVPQRLLREARAAWPKS